MQWTANTVMEQAYTTGSTTANVKRAEGQVVPAEGQQAMGPNG